MKTSYRGMRLVAALGAMALAACASPAAEPSSGGGGTAVAVTLQEWSVNPDVETAPAGEVTFDITNEGPEDAHEFVIVRTDLAPDALPVDENGALDETGEGVEVVDEVEEIAVGSTESITVDLEAGSYVLLCNVFSADEAEAHYAMGMSTAFTVEGG